jgi:hypothetical protein
MKPTTRTNDVSIEERLARFTDRARTRNITQAEPNVGAELQVLEDTVLRLSRAFPAASMDEVTVRRMQANLHSRTQLKGRRSVPRWQSGQSRQRMVFAFAAVVAAVCLAVLAPFLTGSSTSGTASAISPNQVALGASLLAAAVLLGLFIRRRK